MRDGNQLDDPSLWIRSIAGLGTLTPAELDSALSTYCRAFDEPPYNERFTVDDATKALRYILAMRGDLLVGQIGSRVVTIGGGFLKPSGVYHIEELAVAPEHQGQGLGRRTLHHIMNTSNAMAAIRLEIRTNVENARAINLYRSEGFVELLVTEIVAHGRRDGDIAVDERVYLAKPAPAQPQAPILRRVVITYPSGNTTALVFDQMLDVDRKTLNQQVSDAWRRHGAGEPEVEQCGFVTLPRSYGPVARVEMFGGEFCGNATRSAIWIVTGGQPHAGTIEASGVRNPLQFTVEDGVVTLAMPLPEGGGKAVSTPDGWLVQLDGIAHLVVIDPAQREMRDPRALLQEVLDTGRYGLVEQAAAGVTYYNASSDTAEFCVWVKAVDTIFDETACGSGTCAAGIAMTIAKAAPVALKVEQPSGEAMFTQTTYSSESNTVTRSTIRGRVNILYDGELAL